MRHSTPPFIELHQPLSDETIVQLLQWLHQLTDAIEHHYADQIVRQQRQTDPRQQTMWSDDDPPF
jgi:hypothetical protein